MATNLPVLEIKGEGSMSPVKGHALARGARRAALPLMAVGIGIAIWWALAEFVFTPILFASPQSTAQAFVQSIRSGMLWENIVASVSRVAIGYGVGLAVGTPVGLLMGAFKPARAFLDPYVGFLRFLPPIALLPLAIVWFGIGELSKWFLIAFSTSFIMVLNSMAGIYAVPTVKIWAARMLGLSKSAVFRRVLIPSSIPFVVTGMRIALGNAFMTIVAAEMLAANSGLGYMVFTSRAFFQTSNMFVGLITIALIGFASDYLVRLTSGRVLSKYGIHDLKR